MVSAPPKPESGGPLSLVKTKIVIDYVKSVRAIDLANVKSPSRVDSHIRTVHASVQLALAEASTGQWLMQGAIYSLSTTSLDEIRRFAEPLATKGRSLIPVTVEIVDGSGNVGLVATFEWFAPNRERKTLR